MEEPEDDDEEEDSEEEREEEEEETGEPDDGVDAGASGGKGLPAVSDSAADESVTCTSQVRLNIDGSTRLADVLAGTHVTDITQA